MDIKRITSALLGFPLVLIILIFGNNYIVDIKEDGSYLDKEMTYEEYLAKYGNEQ